MAILAAAVIANSAVPYSVLAVESETESETSTEMQSETKKQTETEKKTPTGTTTPHTGDPTNVMGYTMACILSLAAITLLVGGRKKYRR